VRSCALNRPSTSARGGRLEIAYALAAAACWAAYILLTQRVGDEATGALLALRRLTRRER